MVLLQVKKSGHPLIAHPILGVPTSAATREKEGVAGAVRRQLGAATPAAEQPVREAQPEFSFPGTGTRSAASLTDPKLQSALGEESGLPGPSTSQQHSTAAAAAAEDTSAKQLLVSEMQARVAALDLDKAELSAQLSAAHSCIQRLRDAEVKGAGQSSIMPAREGEDAQQQHQTASQSVQVGSNSISS